MDDEVERRLRELKDAAGQGAASSDAAPSGAASGGGPARQSGESSGRPALSGEVIEGPGGARSTGGARGEAFGTGRGSGRGASGRPGPAVRAVSWSFGEARAGRLGLWFGLGLLAFGGYLVAVEFVPGLRIVGSVALLLAGGWALLWRSLGRARGWALYVGAVLVGYGAGGTVANLVSNGRGGWGSLGVGLAFLAIAGWRAARGGGVGWQAWIGAFLTVWGAWGALGATIPGFPTAGDLVLPLVLVLAGALVVRRGLR